MGITGRWLDSLTDAERDRVIQHPDPTFDGRDWWQYERDCGCLVGCVIGKVEPERSEYWGRPLTDYIGNRVAEWLDVGGRFPSLTGRFGAPRMWRVVKARAAKLNRVEVPEPAVSR